MMSTIPHAFGVEGDPVLCAQSVNQTGTKSDAEVVAVAAASDSARMQGVVERENAKGKGVEESGDVNMYAAIPHISLGICLSANPVYQYRPTGITAE
jgi:hypothetical protein